MFFVFPAYGQANDPIGHWTFDTGTIVGYQVLDESGNNLNGTIEGTVTSTAGVINQALAFNGTGNFIEFANDNLTDLTGNISVALWVNTKNNSRTEALVSRYNAGGSETGYLLRIDAAGHVELVIGGNNSSTGQRVVFTDTSTIINDGQWHHIAAVIALGQGVTFYVDGAPTTMQSLNIVARSVGSSLQMGLNPWTAYGTYFAGSLDDVQIYNRVLSGLEVAALFAAGQISSVATPVINPDGGSYSNSVSVSLSDPTSGSSIYYTTDGSNPGTSSALYVNPFTLTGTVMVKAKAAAVGMTSSPVASAAFTVTSPAPAPGPTSGNVGYWTFDTGEVQGSEVLDSSGNNLNGTIVGGVTSVTGVINQALSFNGSNSYITFPLDTLTDLTNDVSLALWIDTANSNRTEAVVSRYAAGGSESGYLLRTDSAGHPQVVIGGNNNVNGHSVTLTDTGKLINDGHWHHVAVVITLAQGAAFYIDGALSSTQALKMTPKASGSILQFALNPWTPYGTYFTGSLDEVRIYNRALQASEVATLANATPPMTNPPPPTPTLSVSPSSLSFSATAGGSNPAAQPVGVTYSGSGNWTASANQTWITLSATSTAVTVGANIAGLGTGTYPGTVTISGVGVNPQIVQVSLAISAAAAPPPPPPVTGNSHYAAPNGSHSGDGSIAHPWDLATALAGPASVKPGDTIWLRGGLYGGTSPIWGTLFSAHVTGTATAPVTIRQYPGERATVNGSIATYGAYEIFWGFEIMSENPDRSGTATRYECMDTYQGSTGIKIINMVLHDCLQGIGWWPYATNSELSGNLIYFNGESGTTRGTGHNVYTQNQSPSLKTETDNILFDAWDINEQGYGSGAAFVQNIYLDGNVSFNAGNPYGSYVDNLIFAVGSGLDAISVNNTFTYFDPSMKSGYSRLGWQFGGVNGTLTATNNHWMGGDRIEMWGWKNLTYTNNESYLTGDQVIMNTVGQPVTGYNFSGNTYYGTGIFSFNGVTGGLKQWQTDLNSDKNSVASSTPPSSVEVFVRPNKYEPGRANIVVYNWPLNPTVSVDVSSVLTVGQSYVVQDAENFYGPPVTSGTYSGGTITIPMVANAPFAQMVGGSQAPIKNTQPQFGVFILLKQ